MKTEQINTEFYGINEDAYLNEEEEEDQVVSFALKSIREKNMSFEEETEYLKKFPTLRMFANTYRALFGEEDYRQLEQENIEKIRTRAWEKE